MDATRATKIVELLCVCVWQKQTLKTAFLRGDGRAKCLLKSLHTAALYNKHFMNFCSSPDLHFIDIEKEKPNFAEEKVIWN